MVYGMGHLVVAKSSCGIGLTRLGVFNHCILMREERRGEGGGGGEGEAYHV